MASELSRLDGILLVACKEIRLGELKIVMKSDSAELPGKGGQEI